MLKKIIIGAVCIIGLAVAISFGGQVPQKPFRDSGNVIDTHAKNNLGQLYQVSYSTSGVSLLEFTVLIDLAQLTFTGSRITAKIKAVSDNDAEVKFYETPVITSSGTPMVAYNRNRELATVPEASFYRNSVISSSGTLLSEARLTDYVDLAPPIIQEWVLPDGGVYLIEMINGTAGNDMGVTIEFFETE